MLLANILFINNIHACVTILLELIENSIKKKNNSNQNKYCGQKHKLK